MSPREKPNAPAEAAERIWHVLASHVGKGRAITAAEIARRTGIGDEAGTSVRAVISDALEFLPRPVAATSTGYFVVSSIEEADEYRADLRSRIEMIGRRIAIFDRKMAAAGVAHEDRRYADRRGKHLFDMSIPHHEGG